MRLLGCLSTVAALLAPAIMAATVPSSNTTAAILSPRKPPPEIPPGWNRFCRFHGPDTTYFSGHIEIYAKEFDLRGGRCGKGLLDNIRGECWSMFVRNWGCDRIGPAGIYVQFSLQPKNPMLPTWPSGCVEGGFEIAARFETAPDTIKCCKESDGACFAGAPGQEAVTAPGKKWDWRTDD